MHKMTDANDTNITCTQFLPKKQANFSVTQKMFRDKPNKDVSHIREYFEGKTIFLTGGTGFLGSLIIEKLLRTCTDVKKIYILVREKKGVDPPERLKEMFNVPAFEPLKKQLPNFCDKLSICIGNCLLPDLGLSLEDVNILKEEVDCILHCAATVRFDANLRKAIYVNIRAVRDILRIAKEMKHLSCFLHISTAFSNCPSKDIGEVFYEPPLKGEQLITLADALNDDLLDAITPTIIDKWPNTYAYTKLVAEDLIKDEVSNLPISVIRPSMILAAVQEPIPGWLDNIYGPSGLMLTASLGLLKTVHVDETKVADIIPVDYVVNAILAAAWETSEKNSLKSTNSSSAKESPIYNCVSGPRNPTTWGDLIHYTLKNSRTIPSTMTTWYYTCTGIKNKYLFLLAHFFLHTLHGYLADFFLRLINRKPMFVDGFRKIKMLMVVTQYFALREWHFKTDHTEKLWKNMSAKDQKLFNFNISKLNWDAYNRSYCKGIRIYMLKDPMETVPQGRRKLFIFKIVHYTLKFLMLYCVYLVLKQLSVFCLNTLK